MENNKLNPVPCQQKMSIVLTYDDTQKEELTRLLKIVKELSLSFFCRKIDLNSEQKKEEISEKKPEQLCQVELPPELLARFERRARVNGILRADLKSLLEFHAKDHNCSLDKSLKEFLDHEELFRRYGFRRAM